MSLTQSNTLNNTTIIQSNHWTFGKSSNSLKSNLKTCFWYIDYDLAQDFDKIGEYQMTICVKSIKNNDEWLKFRKFFNILSNYIDELDEDLMDYSKYKFKMLLELNGLDEDESFHCVKILRNIFLDNRIGVLDLQKPVDLSNNIIALVEF